MVQIWNNLVNRHEQRLDMISEQFVISLLERVFSLIFELSRSSCYLEDCM